MQIFGGIVNAGNPNLAQTELSDNEYPFVNGEIRAFYRKIKDKGTTFCHFIKIFLGETILSFNMKIHILLLHILVVFPLGSRSTLLS